MPSPATNSPPSPSRPKRAILAGLNALVQWLPGVGRIALAAAAFTGIGGCILTVWLWANAYGAGWNAGNAAGYIPISKQVCTSLANVRHQLALAIGHAGVDEMQLQMTAREWRVFTGRKT